LLGKTVGIAYVSTIAAGIVAFFAASIVVPWLTSAGQTMSSAAGTVIEPFITMNIPPVISVMSALVLAFILGLVSLLPVLSNYSKFPIKAAMLLSACSAK